MLLLDDDKEGHATEQLLEECSYQVFRFKSLLEAGDFLGGDFDIVLADIGLLRSQACGSELSLAALKKAPLLLKGPRPTPDDVLFGLKMGSVDFLETPVSPLKLKNIWQHTVRRMMSEMELMDIYDDVKVPASKTSVSTEHKGSSKEMGVGKATCGVHLLGDDKEKSVATQVLISTESAVSSGNKGDKLSEVGEEKSCKTKRSSRQLASANVSSRPPLAIKPHTVQSKSTISGTGGKASPSAVVPAKGPWASLGPLAPGMVWGMPLNPIGQTPGITPPLIPPPGFVPPPPFGWMMGPLCQPPAMPMAPGMQMPTGMPGFPPLPAMFGTLPAVQVQPPASCPPAMASSPPSPASSPPRSERPSSPSGSNSSAQSDVGKFSKANVSDMLAADALVLPGSPGKAVVMGGQPSSLPDDCLVDFDDGLEKTLEMQTFEELAFASEFKSPPPSTTTAMKRAESTPAALFSDTTATNIDFDYAELSRCDSLSALVDFDVFLSDDEFVCGNDCPLGLSLKKSDSFADMISANLLCTGPPAS